MSPESPNPPESPRNPPRILNQKTEVKTKVLRGGKLKSKKGVNLPNTNISLPALTEKDIKDALFAIELDVDWLALSIVRT